ncbi:MAG: imidazole glycerol phosphate synthase subunit HisH [Betaproteobacteria bacterium]
MRVTVIDYGIGNLYSVGRALEHCGADVQFSPDPAAIESAERLVLPGVGAFADGMRGLLERGLVEPIRQYAAAGRPLLGICLGMQMLVSVSEEFGEHNGLGLIPGRVRPVPSVTTDGAPQKVPHIGWSALRKPPGASWQGSILEKTPPGSAVYLVHSFAVVPENTSHRLADCLYGGHTIAAAIRHGVISGCQFHPEKSGEVGLNLLRAFIHL